MVRSYVCRIEITKINGYDIISTDDKNWHLDFKIYNYFNDYALIWLWLDFDAANKWHHDYESKQFFDLPKKCFGSNI